MYGLHHAALPVSDMVRSVAFYEDVVGLDVVGPDDPSATLEAASYVWLQAGPDTYLNLARRPAATPFAGGTDRVDGVGVEPLDDPHVAFDVAAVERRLIAARLDAADRSYRRSPSSLYFRDPDGNLLEVTTWDGPA